MINIKVLHVVGFLGCGGDTTAIMNVKNYIDKNNLSIKFDFVTHDECNMEFVESLKHNGSNIYILPGDVRKIGVIKYIVQLRRILKANQYDCIHFHTSFQSAIGLIVSKWCNIKVRVCHSHTTSIQRKSSKFKELLYLPICRLIINVFSTKKVACSSEAYKYLFGKNKKIDVIYNGLDINKLQEISIDEIEMIKRKINYKKDYKIVGQVGRITDMKNPFFTLELAEKLKSQKFIFVFLGDGSLKKQLQEEIESKKLKNVFVLGRVSNVKAYMKIFDYLLLPSKYGEGLPVVLIEQQIINPNCICISNDNVTKEANIGRVEYIDIQNKSKWLDLLTKKMILTLNINYKEFDINITARKWLNLYLTRK